MAGIQKEGNAARLQSKPLPHFGGGVWGGGRAAKAASMAEPNFKNRTLFHGDNLDFLRGMNSESVHLIATDPPFNKNRDFHATPDSLAAGARFKDRWRWEKDVHEEWTDSIIDDFPAVWEVITAARAAYGDDMGAFLCWLGVRLMEMRRVLRQDGAIFLHIDDTASAWVKCLMDAIFGWKNLRNEIVWQRRHDKHNLARKSMGRIVDYILWYAKSPSHTYNIQYLPYSEEYICSMYKHSDARGRYRLLPCTNESGGNKIYEFRGVKRAWRFKPERMRAMYESDLLYQAKPGSPYQYKKYLKDAKGIKIDSLWTDIPGARGNERTGYPTQKPLALYRRIIAASSNPGDIVLDPFCGCATTPVAAEQLGRQWIGMDIWQGAEDIVLARLQDEWLFTPDAAEKKMFPHVVHIKTAPPARTDENEVAASALRLKIQRPSEPWQRITHRGMTNILAAAQASEGGVICAGCGRVLEREFMQLDHITPKAGNGENHILNRILLCGPCNRRKGDSLTMPGLLKANRKKTVAWMKDEDRAKLAQAAVRERAQWTRDNMNSDVCQALIAGQRQHF